MTPHKCTFRLPAYQRNIFIDRAKNRGLLVWKIMIGRRHVLQRQITGGQFAFTASSLSHWQCCLSRDWEAVLPQQGLGGSVASAGIWRQCFHNRDWEAVLSQQGLGGSLASAGIGRQCCLSRDLEAVLPQQGLGGSVASAGIGRQCCLSRDWEAMLPQQGL